MIGNPSFSDAPWSDGRGHALIHGETTITYSGLRSAVLERERLLASQGLKPGQAVLVPDSPASDLILMLHALARDGAILLPFRAGTPSSDLTELAALTSAEWQWSPHQCRLTRTGFCVSARDISSQSDAIRLLIKTSGSSGTPKVTMLTGEGLLASALSANARLGLAPDDLWLACLRQSHIGGISIGYRCALAGATLLLHNAFDATAVGRDLFAHPITHLSLVPPMLARILDLGLPPPPTLRVLLVGGQALSPALARRAVDAGWPLHVTYGMTETASQIATARVLQGASIDPALAGELLPSVEVDAQDCGSVPTPLRIRGPMLMAGYANPARTTGQGLNHGWFETADLACLSTLGELRILGRADDVLVIGGINVSRARVERTLAEAPGVSDCVVISLEDSVWGHRLVAIFSGETHEKALECWCREHMANPERPRAFLRLESLPLLDSGKYDRIAIKARLLMR